MSLGPCFLRLTVKNFSAVFSYCCYASAIYAWHLLLFFTMFRCLSRANFSVSLLHTSK